MSAVCTFAVPAPAAAAVAAGSVAAPSAKSAAVVNRRIIDGPRAHLLGQFAFADLLLDELLDLMEFALLLLVDERNGGTRRRGAGRAAKAVDVVLRIVRYIVVDDQSDIFDVDASGHDVRGHEDVDLAVLEIEHHLLALRLLQIGVQG